MTEEQKAQFKQKRLTAIPHIAKEISDYCDEHGIKNVIFLDRSARPAATALKAYWETTQQTKERPSIYFLAPKIMEQYGTNQQEVNLFKQEHPYLSKKNEQPTLIFDVCVKEGLTLHNTKKLLEKAGFKDLSTMVTAVHEEEIQYFMPDKILYDNHNLGCHVFGSFFNHEIGVQQDGYSLLATPDSQRVSNVRQNRREIIDAIKATYQ